MARLICPCRQGTPPWRPRRVGTRGEYKQDHPQDSVLIAIRRRAGALHFLRMRVKLPRGQATEALLVARRRLLRRTSLWALVALLGLGAVCTPRRAVALPVTTPLRARRRCRWCEAIRSARTAERRRLARGATERAPRRRRRLRRIGKEAGRKDAAGEDAAALLTLVVCVASAGQVSLLLAQRGPASNGGKGESGIRAERE